jgi:hypothetical protein
MAENVSKRDIHMNQINQSTYKATAQLTTSVLWVRSELNPWVDFDLFKYNGREMWADIHMNKTNQCMYGATGNSEQDKPIHVPIYRRVNEVSSLSSLGMEPVSWLESVQIEWQGNVSNRDIHMNKKNQCTYGATVKSMCSVVWVRSEWNPWVDFHLTEQNGKEVWASVTLTRTRWTNARTEPQESQCGQFSEVARNGTRELIFIWRNRMARKCEQAWHSYEQDIPIHVPSLSIFNEGSSPSSLGMEPVSWL